MEVKRVPLRMIAYARSGDKGSNANIGVIAYTENGYRFLMEHLTEKKVKDYFKRLPITNVKKYALANLWAVNLVLEGVLGVGGSRSLRSDAQGKSLGQAILEMPLDVPIEIINEAGTVHGK